LISDVLDVPISTRETQGVRNPQGLQVGYAGVGVWVAIFVPSPNPYLQGRGQGFSRFFPWVFQI
jgi:hypothetical protein